jgi:hypothetical protein
MIPVWQCEMDFDRKNINHQDTKHTKNTKKESKFRKIVLKPFVDFGCPVKCAAHLTGVPWL